MFRFLLFLVLSISSLGALAIGPWENIRFSGRTVSNQAYLRTETDFTGITVNKLIYDNGAGMTEVNQTLYNPASNTYQAPFPVTDSGRYLGLKLKAGDSHENIVPVYYQGTELPTINQLNTVTVDSQGETTYNYLDINKDFFGFSNTKFYAAIQNRGGGFPTSQNLGTVYLAYMCVIAPPGSDPNDPNVVVWALNYMNVPLGGISPGLFKITGTGTDDLIRIGNIAYNIDTTNNLLVMSCDISALLADPDFAAWYNTSAPSFGFASLTSRTTVIPFETVTHDQTEGGKIHAVPLLFNPLPNQAPVLSNPVFHAEDDSVWFGITYEDNEDNFPLTASVSLNESQTFNLTAMSYDFTEPVIFRTSNLISLIDEYDNLEAVFSLSDNNIAFSTERLYFTYIRGLKAPEDGQLEITPTELILSWSPVTQTLEGNTVTVAYYRIEASPEPYFSTYSVLGSTIGTTYSLPLNLLTGYKFYRIIAVK